MNHLINIFPNLEDSHFQQTSPQDGTYNCLAWAANDSEKWWSPIIPYYWPSEVPREQTLSAYQQAYAQLEYEECESSEYEEGYEKIAIYVNRFGKPTHAARQLQNGLWTSKCGGLEDIEHTLEGLEGDQYGKAVCFMKRKQVNGSTD